MTKLLVRWIAERGRLADRGRNRAGLLRAQHRAALLAALVIGFVNATLGALLKIITLPFTILTFGLFLLVVNALMLEFSAWFVPGFEVRGFAAAFWGALVLSLIHMVGAARCTKD